MPLPLILGIAAALAGSTGVALGVNGGMKMKKANDRMNDAEKRNKANINWLETTNKRACTEMDILGNRELNALKSLGKFQNLFEKIKNRPEIDDVKIGEVTIPKFSGEELEKASIGAGVLIGGLGGATLGTAGGFAASGATTAAVMALGTASTGTAISSLGGVAATNATLAALGGGSLAAGGGGMALGATMLGAASLGVGLLVGGVIFNFTGSSIEGKAEKAWDTMLENEKQINKIVSHLNELTNVATNYNMLLAKVEMLYNLELDSMEYIVNSHKVNNRVDYFTLNEDERLTIENTILAVGVLYNMCKVQIVLKSNGNDIRKINYREIDDASKQALAFINNQ